MAQPVALLVAAPVHRHRRHRHQSYRHRHHRPRRQQLCRQPNRQAALIAALMVLSVIATALLAVALTEPTPAAAQGGGGGGGGGGSTTQQVDIYPEASSTMTATAQGVTYTLTPTCGSTITGITAQTNSDGSATGSNGALRHNLDYRCDWEVRFCPATVSLGRTPSGGTTFEEYGAIATSDTSFTLNKGEEDDPANPGTMRLTNQLVYTAAAAEADRTKPVEALRFTASAEVACTTTVKFTVTGSGVGVAAVQADIKYTLVPGNCADGVLTTPDSQDELSGRETSSATLSHDLDFRCDWDVTVCGALSEPTDRAGTPHVTSRDRGQHRVHLRQRRGRLPAGLRYEYPRRQVGRQRQSKQGQQ